MANIPNIPMDIRSLNRVCGCGLADSNYSQHSHIPMPGKSLRGETHRYGAALPGAAVYLYSKIIFFLLCYKRIGI
jgi:hypothetical protein